MRYGHLVMSIFCAWVLWVEGVSNGINVETYPADGFSDRESCESQLPIRRLKAEHTPNTSLYFHCLPDTVDPRAPKAGQ